MKRIGVLLVHGIGEQKRFSMLEEATTNFYKALIDMHPGACCRQLLTETSAARQADEVVWREAPVRLRWRMDGEQEVEAVFREVHWADLDDKWSWTRWFKFVFWGLSVSGVPRRTDTKKPDGTSLGSPGEYGMISPPPLGPGQLAWLRIRLFFVSVVFLQALLTLGIGNWILKRFSIYALEPVLKLLYDYLGDVKLYQDENVRWDRIEGAGEKSRVTIRRRMMTTLVQMALAEDIDGYYIVAHSLGTIIAFNGLMEPDSALPNYLTEEMWQKVAATQGLGYKLPEAVHKVQMPDRPLWLDPYDAISREQLFAKLKGLITVGSPLDKFSAVWPRIVPVNAKGLSKPIPWYNVADVQDIVGDELDLLTAPETSAQGEAGKHLIGGLALENYSWADRWLLFFAHTSYLSARAGQHDRLINRLVTWVAGGGFSKPPHRAPLTLAMGQFMFYVTLAGVAVALTVLASQALQWATAALDAFSGADTPEVLSPLRGVAATLRDVLEALHTAVHWTSPPDPSWLHAGLDVMLTSAVVVLMLTLAGWLARWRPSAEVEHKEPAVAEQS